MKNGITILVFVLFVCLNGKQSIAQAASSEGGKIVNLPVKKILNHPSATTSFKDLQNKITLVDFFGTWCVPCIKALPHLTSIRQQFKNDVSIVLVSNETEAQLNKFIKGRKDFSFPVIVDEDNQWNDFFQPPSLPYTVVLNEEGSMLAITEAENITADSIQKWLAATHSKTTSGILIKTEKTPAMTSPYQKSSNATVQLSQDFIYKAKTGERVDDLSSQLKNISYQTLVSSLTTDNEKKAFWINLYNGFTQASLKAAPESYKNRNEFFSAKFLQVAGEDLSLDDVEHGILRRSKIKWSLGHLNKFFPSKKEKQLRVDELDYRIHFALNCGAKSCPPIAFYNPENLDAQLDVATKAYLSGEAEYDSKTNRVMLPKLMSWFRADFGGKKGMIKILKQFNIIPADSAPKIGFKDYDWTLSLSNYTN